MTALATAVGALVADRLKMARLLLPLLLAAELAPFFLEPRTGAAPPFLPLPAGGLLEVLPTASFRRHQYAHHLILYQKQST